MSTAADKIHAQLATVARVREQRSADAALDAKVVAVKTYQQLRFRRSYPDLLSDARYGPAARFFLEELYGPQDYADRDEQFERIVGPLVRLFPGDIVETVERLARLHALSEELDLAMAGALPGARIRALDYVSAWQSVARPLDRMHQVEWMLEVGRALDRYTRNPLLRHSLKAMRAPARAAGLSALQRFLEEGFDTFRQMRGAEDFLAVVSTRELALIGRLYEVELDREGEALVADGNDPLGQLP